MHSRLVFNANSNNIKRQVANKVMANTPSRRCLLAVPLRLRVIEVARVTPIGLCDLAEF